MKLRPLSPFQLARIKLSVWYMVIVSLLIGVFTYLTFDAKKSAYLRVYQVIDKNSPGSPQVSEFANTFAEFNKKFQQRILIFDGFLLVGAAFASYFLSGKTLKQIQEMMEEQESFASDVSHGLRTPLATMLLEIEATERTTKRLPDEIKSLLLSLREELQFMKHITEGLLSLVRSGNDPIHTTFETCELDKLLDFVYKQMLPHALIKKQKLTINTQKGVKIKGNKDQLKQVFLILVDNAIKYSREKDQITIELKKQKSLAQIQIIDTGFGIVRNEQAMVFNRFFRSEDKNKIGIKGTGLGLTIADKIIKQHDGSIRVWSKFGKGTTFTVTLPR